MSLITLLHLSPVMLFAMTNLILASARVPFAEFYGECAGISSKSDRSRFG
jgi:hypothetical protein